MSRSRGYLLLVGALAVALAACSAPQQQVQSNAEVITPAKKVGAPVSALADWTADSVLTAEVLGTGLGNADAALDTATFPIPDPSTVVTVYVQVVTKAGTSGVGSYEDPTEVVIEARDAANQLLGSKSLTAGTVEAVAVVSQDGMSGTTGISHEAEFSGQVASVSIDISDNTVDTFPASPRALIVTVFRDMGDGTSSAGVLPNLYVFGNDDFPDAVRTIPLPAGFAGGDVTVTFAISDLKKYEHGSTTDNDPRIIHYSASAGGVTANATVDEPNMNSDLAIVGLVLSGVPAGTTEVEARVYSPHEEVEVPEGDSVYWNTVNVTVTTPEVGGEGCTPGYWRQEHHFDSWTGYVPSDLFSTVFGEVITVRTGGKTTENDPTLLQAVWAVGGGVNALARHATAALLNTTSAGVDYPYTTDEVIALVQDALASGDFETAKDTLATANGLGCDLN